MPCLAPQPSRAPAGRTRAGRLSSSDSPDRSGSSRVLGACGAPVLGRSPRHGANKSKGGLRRRLSRGASGEARDLGARPSCRPPAPPRCPRPAPPGPDTAALTCCCGPGPGFRRRCHRTGSRGGCSADPDSPTRSFAEGWPSRRAAPLRLGAEPHPPRAQSGAAHRDAWRREAAPPAARAKPEPSAPAAAAGPRPSASAGRDRTHPLAGPGGLGVHGAGGAASLSGRSAWPARPPPTTRSQRLASRSEALNR